jgi:3-dehydroquinate synthase
VVVTNPTVGGLYAERALGGLEAAGFEAMLVEVPDGEVYKTLDTASRLYDEFVGAGLDRSGAVLALGGGVIGDLVGYAAATYMRGVPLVQLPTTLLAMVDASIGGKVAVDHPRGKNLVGAFKEPLLVVSDPTVLQTLPDVELRNGLAEVVKAAVVGSPALFAHLEQCGIEDLVWIIEQAIQVKVTVVEEDPYEAGRRALLNLGHTFGHALELLSGYRMRHGEAVSIGMVIAARVAARLGLCDLGLVGRLVRLLERLGLPVSFSGREPAQVWEAMATDKKRRGGRLRYVLPRDIGEVTVSDQVSREVVLAVLAEEEV